MNTSRFKKRPTGLFVPEEFSVLSEEEFRRVMPAIAGGSPTVPFMPGADAVAVRTSNLAVTSTETIIVQYHAQANSLAAGATFGVWAHGTISASSAGTITSRIRVGTAGTTAGDTQACASPATGSATTAVGWVAKGLLTVQTAGATGTCIGNIHTQSASSSTASAQSATITINTTVATWIDLSVVGGGTSPSITVTNALIWLLQ